MHIDHIFLRATDSAPEAEFLREWGLVEGSSNHHPGQGTANRRFFFHNAYLELLWIADAAEVCSDTTRPTRLHERLVGGNEAVSPFGVCVRPGANEESPAFPSWDYAARYLPKGMTISVGHDTPLSEPMWFVSPKGAAGTRTQEPCNHPVGVRNITSVAITMPKGEQRSQAAQAICASTGLALKEGEQHLIEITFDHGARGRRHDLRPALPMIFNY